MNFKTSKVERLLCLCIRHCDFLEKEKIRNLYFELGDCTVYGSAKLNRVESIVEHALSICLDEGKLPAHWNKEYKVIENKLIYS